MQKQWWAGGIVLLALAAIGMTNVFAVPKANRDGQDGGWLVGEQRQSSARPSWTTFDYESTPLIANVLYRRLSAVSDSMAPDGANGVNAEWESNSASVARPETPSSLLRDGDHAKWYIESQRYGEQLVIGGVIENDSKAIAAGFKMFDWGFSHQAADGSFPGTGDPFHSTSFFVEAVAHTLLFLQQSPQSRKYADQIARYKPLVHRAARWLILPHVWQKGTEHNLPYTHRRYLVAAALGLTGKLTGDRQLLNYARHSLEDGLSLQLASGINPEKGGSDSSYQMVGVVYAEYWVTYFPNDLLTPRVTAMIDKGLTWEQTMILPTGEISREGNTRSGGQETARSGKVKQVDYKNAIRGFAAWASLTGNPQWTAIAQKIVQYYYKSP